MNLLNLVAFKVIKRPVRTSENMVLWGSLDTAYMSMWCVRAIRSRHEYWVQYDSSCVMHTSICIVWLSGTVRGTPEIIPVLPSHNLTSNFVTTRRVLQVIVSVANQQFLTPFRILWPNSSASMVDPRHSKYKSLHFPNNPSTGLSPGLRQIVDVPIQCHPQIPISAVLVKLL